MRRSVWGVLICFVVSFAAVSSAARPDDSESPIKTTSSQDGINDLFEQYYSAIAQGQFKDALQIADQLPMDPSNTDGRAIVDSMRATALFGLNRDAEAQKLLTEISQLGARTPYADYNLFMGGIATNHHAVAADALDRMIAKYPDTVRDIDTDLMDVFMREADKTQVQRNENRIIALAHLGYCANSECGDGYATDAIKILVRRGDFTSATNLLPTLKDSDALQQMLVLRRFAPLWPAIEAMAGSHFSKIKEANLAAAEKTYRASPSDYKQLQRYVDALAQAGRLKEAIALRSKLPWTKEGFASADEPLSWAVNSIAYALDEAGQMDEADRLFEQLNDGASPDADWLVNTKINRLEVLLSDGRYDKVIPLLDSTAKVKGSPFAYQLIRQIRYCAVVNVSGSNAAAKYLPDLLTHASDSFDATVDALVCAGDLKDAEKVALEGLAQTDPAERAYFEAHFVRDLQIRSWDGYGVNAWHDRWQNFRKRPAIAVAFTRLGRDLPEEFAAESTH